MNILDPLLTERTAFTGTERFYVGINEATPDYYVEHGTLLSNVALLDAANTFTANQTIDAQLDINAGSTTTVGLIVNAASGATANLLELDYNGAVYCGFQAKSGANKFTLASVNLGDDVAGPNVQVGRNTSNSTASYAPGHVIYTQSDNTKYSTWVHAGLFRIHDAQPTGSNVNATVDASTAGFVVGTQTSNMVFKNLLGPGSTAKQSLNHIRDAVSTIQRFTYRSGSYGGQEFDGIVIHNDAGLQRYGMDADEEHPGGKSLNEVNAIGDLMKVVAMQADQIDALQDRIAELEKTI